MGSHMKMAHWVILSGCCFVIIIFFPFKKHNDRRCWSKIVGTFFINAQSSTLLYFQDAAQQRFFFSLSITIQTKVWKTAVCLSYWCLIIIHCCLVWGVRMIACSQTTMEDEPWSAISQQATCSWEVLCCTQRWNQGYSCQCFHTSNSAAQGCGEECTQHHHSHWAMWPTFENQDLQLENFQERIMFLAAMHNHKITKANTLKITVYCLRAA